MNTNPQSAEIAVYGLCIALLFFSAFDASAKYALWAGIFFLVMAFLNAWFRGSIQQVVSTFFTQGSF